MFMGGLGLPWLSCTPTPTGEADLALMHTHPREADLAPHAPHAHARCLWAGWRGLTWLDGGGKGYGYNSIKTELLLYI